MNVINKTLSQMEIFLDLSSSEIEDIEKLGKVKKFARGETIFSQGQEAKSAYVVIEGRVKVYKIGADGRTTILHIFGPKDMFGEAVMFSGKSYPAFAQALEDSEIFSMPKSDFLTLVEAKPKVAIKMLGAQAMMLRRFAAKIEDLSLRAVSARLAGYFLEQIDIAGQPSEEGYVLKLSMNKSLLAAYLGTISETLSRTFHDFKEKGIIKEEKHGLIVTDLLQLQKLAQS
ncbi:hypothetical protein LCGC14_0825350 [marine sediment metagenome]|uniref:Cyclic nucleotide-binding domain-containing protein n=1 Tax=marine sediment metagenome TaxID=412755 RepID=A0A0F9S2H3_9ZZZZ